MCWVIKNYENTRGVGVWKSFNNFQCNNHSYPAFIVFIQTHTHTYTLAWRNLQLHIQLCSEKPLRLRHGFHISSHINVCVCVCAHPNTLQNGCHKLIGCTQLAQIINFKILCSICTSSVLRCIVTETEVKDTSGYEWNKEKDVRVCIKKLTIKNICLCAYACVYACVCSYINALHFSCVSLLSTVAVVVVVVLIEREVTVRGVHVYDCTLNKS